MMANMPTLCSILEYPKKVLLLLVSPEHSVFQKKTLPGTKTICDVERTKIVIELQRRKESHGAAKKGEDRRRKSEDAR
ncbi:hypothetical protein [Dubosiella newyorkensis]|uniref:hypothetical protein n=1 Tax=Dubosiella newyorkensis TaxID=1862672 RepID=UPI003F676FAC